MKLSGAITVVSPKIVRFVVVAFAKNCAVPGVAVTSSGDRMTLLVPDPATATKTPLPKTTSFQSVASLADCAVQVMPSGEVMTWLVPLYAIATKSPSP